MKFHKIFTQEKFSKVNMETKSVMRDYLNECKAEGRTERTLEEYENRLKYTSVLILEEFHNKSILEMTRTDFRDLMLILQLDFELSSSRINSIISVIVNCLNYVEDDEDSWINYNKNPTRRIKRLAKKPVKNKVFLSREEVKKIIDSLVANWRLQDAVMVSLMYDSGCRISELHQVKKHNLLSGNVTNEIIRKGQKKRTKLMYLNDTKKLIEKWLWQRGEDDIDDLFIYPSLPTAKTREKKRINVRTLYSRVKKQGKRINKEVTPHVFRRSRAENLKRGEDERFDYKKFSQKEIQILLGHSDMATTEIYLKDDSEEIMLNMIDLINK